MAGKENPIEIPPLRPFEFQPHPIDILRNDFNHHVIGPLSHVIIIRTLDKIGDGFIQSLRGELGQEIRDGLVRSNPRNQAVNALEKLSEKLRDRGETYFVDQKIQPITPLISPRQRSAAVRFGTPQMEGSLELGLFSEITTIASAIRIINTRHPELELHDVQKLADFLRSPETLHIFRGFATGGNAFIDGFILNSHPATLPWGADRKKPVLETSGEAPRIRRDVLSAARRSRKINEKLLEYEIPNEPNEIEAIGNLGLIKSSKRISSGCPVRFLHFQTNVESLVMNDLSLSNDQVEKLTSLTQPPAIQKYNDSTYLITRDSYAEASDFFASALEVLAAT